MDWNEKDIGIALSAKEYVDTAIIPLVPITWGEEAKVAVKSGEFISLFSKAMEHKYKGRILLLPPFTYLVHEEVVSKKERLRAWEEVLKKEGLKHVFYLTSDHLNKEMEKEVEGTVIWLPALPLAMMDEKTQQELLHAQIDEVMTLLKKEWE
ncbi:YpiF family protein [Priestia taiwanensis]|uniref:DUF2487 family protein n=1 Tax=Priestia taiwanensis TaxID=1347902 RepID=A0A917AJG4_9BACI|nr:YpiF family protein [Priestia taiwanensis]MBM7361713.1 hypothetical protein [Priestia taiwanensis]GGE56387.1 hypothetical protein GCM10007140_03380 [Priestia taiwanensis]